MAAITRTFGVAVIALAALLCASCATVNKLDWYDLRGCRLAVDMKSPPAPTMDINYDVTLNRYDPVYSAVSVLTNIAKANQAVHAEAAMREALNRIDAPEIIRDEAFHSCVARLDAEPVDSRWDADYVLSLDIEEWGIRDDSWSPVSMYITLSASVRSTLTDELVWRRSISVSESASPDMFGADDIVGTMVTTEALSRLTARQLASGFQELASQAAHKVARALEQDIDDSRGDW